MTVVHIFEWIRAKGHITLIRRFNFGYMKTACLYGNVFTTSLLWNDIIAILFISLRFLIIKKIRNAFVQWDSHLIDTSTKGHKDINSSLMSKSLTKQCTFVITLRFSSISYINLTCYMRMKVHKGCRTLN